MNFKEFLNISGFIKNLSLASFCCKTAIYMQNPVQKSRTDYFFPHLSDVFSFELIYIYIFFSETFSYFFPPLLLIHLTLLFVKPLWRAWEVTLETIREHAFPTRLKSGILSVHEAHCKCRQHTSITKHNKCSSCYQKHCVKASAQPGRAPIPVVPEQAFSATRDVRRHCSDR